MRMHVAVIDDNPLNITLMQHLLKLVGDVEAHTFLESAAALSWCQANDPDLIIVDYMMPPPDGLTFIRAIRSQAPGAETPMLMVTANIDEKVRHAALESGCNDFLTKPLNKVEFLARVRNMLALRASQKKLRDHAGWLAEEVRRATALILQREQEAILRLTRAAEYRDPETGAHILRMASYSQLIARGLGLSQDEQDLILKAAPMHDIGKVGIADHILLKPGRLDDDEMAIMRTHARIGYDILKDSESPLIQLAAVIAHSHHEKYDGSGYPQQLAGDTIPLHGRIVAVADVFDALTSERPYKKAWELDRALDFMREQRGRHFDPECLDIFVDCLDEVLLIRQRYQDD